MESSSTSRPAPARTNSNGKTPRQAEKTEEKVVNLKNLPPTHRGTRYKEKFQALREKYEQVTQTHQSYQRDLALADEKVRQLQEECNLLLDAVDIAVPAQPSLIHYLSRDPIPPEYHSYQVPFPAVPPGPVPEFPPPPPGTVMHTNGAGYPRQ